MRTAGQKATKKTVHVTGYCFDALPGHITISARESGTDLKVAASRALHTMLQDPRLWHQQIGSFKVSVVVVKG